METAIDILCEKLALDPWSFAPQQCEGRRPGLAWPGLAAHQVCRGAPGGQGPSPLCDPADRAVSAGVGSPAWVWRNNTGPSSAVAVVHNDGRVRLTEGSPDIGGTRASIAQQFAETLGIPFEGDPSGSGAYGCGGLYVRHRGSGVTFKTGWAAYHAAQDIKRQMCRRLPKPGMSRSSKVTYA